MKKALRILLRVALAMVLTLALLLVVSLDTVDYRPYTDSGYYRETMARFQLRTSATTVVTGELSAGFGHAKLTPSINEPEDLPNQGKFRAVPLAGYGERKGKPAAGVHDDVMVKAIVLRAGSQIGVFVSADALIIPREVAEIAIQELGHTGLQREQLYFSATHTHCSLGGWGEGFVAEMFAGEFQPGARIWFAHAITEAVRAALKDVQSASIGRGRFAAPDFVRNRLIGDKGKIDPEFSYVLLKQSGGRSAVMGAYAAHATVLSGRVMEFSADYPGAWQRAVEQETGGMAMFLAGGVGSHGPVAGGKGFEGVSRMGQELARLTLKQFPETPMTNWITFGLIGSDMFLPAMHVRVSDGIRLRPWLASRLVSKSDRTFLQAFRLDDTVWISTPCDFSGELALELKESLRDKGLRPVVTSFNGDYIGYVIPGRYYNLDGYEPRVMSFYGPTVPDYMTHVIRTLALHLARAR